MLLARNLRSESDIAWGREIRERRLVVSAGDIKYPVKKTVRFNCSLLGLLELESRELRERL